MKVQTIKKHSSKGITLVALVVTIIVLLILAGVTIMTLFGENGLITMAQKAKSETENAQARTKVDLAMADWHIVKHTQNDKDFGSYLKEKFGNANVTPNGDRFNVKVGGYTFIVDSNGNIELANGISLNKNTLKLSAGKSETLTVSYFGGASGAITWASSNTSVATVNNGVVTIPAGVTTGTAEITATCGSYTAKCTVTIVQKVTSITINPSSIEIEQGETKALSVTTVPSGSNIEELEYTSSDATGKITVNSEGKVTVTSDATVGVAATITVKGKLSGKTATATITVKAPTLPIGEYVEYDVAYTDVKLAEASYTKSNGWRILDVGSKNADGSYSAAKIISTGIPAMLYYHGLKAQDGRNTIGLDNKPNWWGDHDQVEALYGKEWADYGYYGDGSMCRYYVAAGLAKNFTSIPLERKTSGLTTNKGGYSSILAQGSPATGEITGEIFKIDDKAGGVHNLTLAELNTAINKINGDNSRGLENADPVTSYDLFYLRGLTRYNYSSTSTDYWLATPHSSYHAYITFVKSDGTIYGNCTTSLGIRPVVSLTSDIYKDGDIWKIK